LTSRLVRLGCRLNVSAGLVGPRAEQLQCLRCATGGVSVVDDQPLSVRARDLEVLVMELEFAARRVVHVSRPAADSGVDVVSRPEASELIASDRQLADEVVEERVVDLWADERAHARDRALHKRLPFIAI